MRRAGAPQSLRVSMPWRSDTMEVIRHMAEARLSPEQDR